jgi:hypothetical protein
MALHMNACKEKEPRSAQPGWDGAQDQEKFRQDYHIALDNARVSDWMLNMVKACEPLSPARDAKSAGACRPGELTQAM